MEQTNNQNQDQNQSFNFNFRVPSFFIEWLKVGRVNEARKFIVLRSKFHEEWWKDSERRRKWAVGWKLFMANLLFNRSYYG